jgi:hypothetical protein
MPMSLPTSQRHRQYIVNTSHDVPNSVRSGSPYLKKHNCNCQQWDAISQLSTVPNCMIRTLGLSPSIAPCASLGNSCWSSGTKKWQSLKRFLAPHAFFVIWLRWSRMVIFLITIWANSWRWRPKGRREAQHSPPLYIYIYIYIYYYIRRPPRGTTAVKRGCIH